MRSGTERNVWTQEKWLLAVKAQTKMWWDFHPFSQRLLGEANSKAWS